MGLFYKIKSNIDTVVEKTKEGIITINKKQNAPNERIMGEKIEQKIKNHYNFHVLIL